MSKKEIKKVAVIGAGTMGSGIAAQLANAGIEVVLLDKFEGKAQEAIDRMVKAVPNSVMEAGKDVFNELLMTKENAKFIKPGTTDDNLDELADCDWVIETILAPHPIRQQLYKDMEKIAPKDVIFSSNTSTMQIGYMTDGQSDHFKSRFLNTHFFNPVRWMHLLEVISDEHTDPDVLETIMDFGSRVLGKKAVHCKDARGFIANRIGMYAMERAKVEALAQDMKIEDVDAIMGKAFGFPPLGLFKLADEVGIPVIEHVRTDLHENLPETDDFSQIFTGYDEIKDMMEKGLWGNRTEISKTADGEQVPCLGGYYRKKTDAEGNIVKNEKGKPVKEARDLKSGEYRDFEDSPYFKFEKILKKEYGGYQQFFDKGDTPSKFAWPVIRDIMIYVLDHAEELGYDLQDIDDAMRAGFNWEFGPFELLDKFGVDWFTDKLQAEGSRIPELLKTANRRPFYREGANSMEVMNFDGNYAPIKREDGVLSLEDIKASSEPLITHNSASLWDIGDGIVALEFHATQNVIDPSMFWVINESIKLVSENPDKYKGMVIYNDANAFSFGANLKLVEVFMDASNFPLVGSYVEQKLLKTVEELVFQGQSVYNALKQAPFPVVGAPKGQPKNMALGGGCEVLMHCDAIQAGPEQVLMLPETGLGLLPGWGGTTRYLQRAFERPGQKGGPMPAVIETALALAIPPNSAATCSQDARKKLWLSKDDGISMNQDRVLADAKAKALEMSKTYAPSPMPQFNLPGISGKGAIRMDIDKMYQKGGNPAKGGLNHVDVRVADALADVLTGGETIKRDDVDLHIDDPAVAAKLKQIMDERGEDEIGVHPGLTLNISRMLQLERDRFLDRFRDRATWKRVRHTMAKGMPLREDRLDPAPSPNDIRNKCKHEDLPRRQVTGKPLEGKDLERLKAMADMTREFYRLNGSKTTIQQLTNAPRTLAAARKVFKLLP